MGKKSTDHGQEALEALAPSQTDEPQAEEPQAEEARADESDADESEADDHEDRRRFRRVPREMVLSISPATFEDALAHSLNVSLGGIRFQVFGQSLEIGQILEITLTLGLDSVSVVGKVIRFDSVDDLTQDVAVKFCHIDEYTEQLLEEHLRRLQLV